MFKELEIKDFFVLNIDLYEALEYGSRLWEIDFILDWVIGTVYT